MPSDLSPLRQGARGHTLLVRVTPKASRNEVVGIRLGVLVVKVTAVPENGKANVAVRNLLSKESGVARSCFELVAGETDRNKVFRLESQMEAVQHWLRGLQKE